MQGPIPGNRLLEEISVPASIVPPAWLVGARSRLLDSWTPLPEFIRLPEMRRSGGELRVSVAEGITHRTVQRSKRQNLILRLRGQTGLAVVDVQGPVFDARDDHGQNFAHAATLFGVRALAAKRAAREHLGIDELTVLIPGDARGFVTRVLQFYGLKVLQTFAPVRGTILSVDVNGHDIEAHVAPQVLPRGLVSKTQSGGETPKKLYLARRDTRAVANEAEILPMLEERGFVRIFAEELSVLDQFRHVSQASHIVGIHGAAIGPMIYRSVMPDRTPLRLVELFGSGYIVTVFREMAFNLGDSWIGVRGRITPEALRDLDQRGLPRSHERSSFVVDPETLRIALEASERGGDPYYAMHV